ncbi:hypothetical protein MKX01_033668 [Papaver californicum]|nr:hypothetical protein MKX01_033668 [Papaver californicum]
MAAYNFSIVHLSVFLCYTISLVSFVYGGGFSVDLIHRDSPLSPFYSSTDKPSDRAQNAIRRSIDRCSHYSKKSSSAKSSDKLGNITSTVIPGVVGDYLMVLAVGTPALPLLAIADTGSDIIWFQCTPCDVCFPQITSPIFAPENSSTYKNIPCATNQCDALNSVSNAIPCDGNACKYSISYADGSISIGNFARETLTFQSTSGANSAISVTNMAFGCGHNNTGLFSSLGAGLVGLDAGPFSLVSQLGSIIDNKFSYCLVNVNENTPRSSKLTFGSNPKLVTGSKVVSTPIIFKDNQFFYFLTLEAISVGDIRIPYNTSSTSSNEVPLEEGNIVIDSGSTITSLPTDFYAAFEAEMKKAIKIDSVLDPNTSLRLCYSVDSDPSSVPIVTAHFTNADIVLNTMNLFKLTGDNIEFVCLAFLPTDDVAIYGNIVQNNFIVEYDLMNKLVSFMPTDCKMA